MKNKNTDIVILSASPFPYGGAETNRIISYAKIIAEDLKIHYVSITPDFLMNPANQSKGLFNGIKYEYAPGTSKWDPNWTKWRKAYHLIKGRLNMFKILYQTKPSTVILVSWNLSYTKWLIWFSKIIKYRLIIELTELRPFLNTYNIRKLYSLYSKVDGFLCISKEIMDKLQPIGNSVDRFHLPMSVDVERFSVNRQNIKNSEKYFVMCSGNNWERDGAIDSINAFLEFRKIHPEFKLMIAGILNDKTEYSHKFKQIVESNFENGVVYLGRLTADKMPEYIMNATAAVMTPHKDYDSGGFPTKLGEYLASGIPVICTAVSEIPDYLNRTNSYICQPNDLKAMVQSMKDIVENESRARIVGGEGKKVANTVFNVATYKKDLIHFLLNEAN